MNSQQPSEASGLNRDRADEVMKAKGLQALIATTPENIHYVIGSQLRASNWTMQIYAILPADRSARPCIVIPTNRLGVVAQFGITNVDIFAYSDFFVEGTIEGKPSTADIDLFYSLLQTTVIHQGSRCPVCCAETPWHRESAYWYRRNADCARYNGTGPGRIARWSCCTCL